MSDRYCVDPRIVMTEISHDCPVCKKETIYTLIDGTQTIENDLTGNILIRALLKCTECDHEVHLRDSYVPADYQLTEKEEW